ncbi:MAG TPA: efflux RND transporter periplasmic adaptor subunit, partial [Gammaproteobacteria bacterium]|nr:efflux RND transporter periplasmic adaptor subunit [Gammaproteobacteria bacterium]
VYTVRDGKISIRNVGVAREFGGLAVISKGLSKGDVVVVHVPRHLAEGVAASARILPFAVSAAAAASAGD